MLIDGRWLNEDGRGWIERESPAHDVPVGRWPNGTAEDANAAVAAARHAFDHGDWPHRAASDRADVLRQTAHAIRAHTDDLARMETLESGKPIAQARVEIGGAAGLWDFAADLCRSLHGESHNQLGPDMLGLSLLEPIGVVALITPWNFPLLIASQKLPFAFAAGCTCVLKPSELTSGTTLRLARFLAEAGLPDGVLNVVTGYGDPVGETFAAHEDVDMVSFTGSTAVGKRIVEASAGNLKKTALELGGKNPQIVFADGDLDAALDAVVFGVYFNMGECCNSSSRILVQSSIADAFMERVVARSKEVPVGDPLDESTKVGAIINQAQMDKIAGHIASGKQSGATLRLGGEPLASKRGRYFPPTVFDHVPPEAGIAREEIFGPVLSALRFDDADDALRLANDTCYGLSAGLWTSDLDTALRFSRGLRAGTVWVNTWMSGYPELAFGGYRQSGLGRELGLDAVREYCEPKTVQLHIGPRTTSWL